MSFLISLLIQLGLFNFNYHEIAPKKTILQSPAPVESQLYMPAQVRVENSIIEDDPDGM